MTLGTFLTRKSIRVPLLVFVLVATFLAGDRVAHGATVSAIATPETSGGAIAIEIRLATDSDSINAVEGTINIPENITDVKVTTSGSAFSLWVSGPTYEIGDRAIHFTGGAPGGIGEGKDVLLFTIFGKTQVLGNHIFTPINVSVYENDGKGTLAPIQIIASKVEVTKIDSQISDLREEQIEKDDSAPRVTAVVGKDTSLFEGSYFLSFYGTDTGSGIARFEVSEGFGSFKEHKEYYVLSDQKLGSLIRVRAVDGAGNSKTTWIFPEHPFAHKAPYVVIALALLLVLGIIWRIRKNRAYKVVNTT